MSRQNTDRSRKLKELALQHGFMGAGISKAQFMEDEADHLEDWLTKGYHGEMSYMANHFDLRVDPTKLVPGAKSVVSLIYNYFPLPLNPDASASNTQSLATAQQPGIFVPISDRGLTTHDSRLTKEESETAEAMPQENDSFKISRYAYGEDYHKVVRRKLKSLVKGLKDEFGDFHARVFVDSAPVLERDWAKRSGVGWTGKNTLLIHPKKGSYFFLAEIISDLEFEYDQPIRDHCGTCTRCIDACPTDAISPEGYVLDGSKCISYLTIELKSGIPEDFKGQMENWIFGCDICQEVCPWNRFAEPHQEPAFVLNDDIMRLEKKEWTEITEEVFNSVFEKSPLKRMGYEGLIRNIQFQSE